MAKSKRNGLAGNYNGTLTPAQRKKKQKYDAAFSAKPDQVKKRMETNKANKKAKTYGKMTAMGKDRSHTKDGKLVLEDRKANRGRNGRDGKSTLK